MLIYLGQKGCYFLEELLDVHPRFGADFLKEDIVVPRHLEAFLLADVSILQVNFVGKEGDDDSLSPLVLDVVDPFLYTFERVSVGDIVDNDCNGSVSDVVGNECLESFLAGGVPELQPDGLVLEEDVLRDEVDADGGSLCYRRGTCSLPSNMS